MKQTKAPTSSKRNRKLDPWTEKKSETVQDCRIFTVEQSLSKSPRTGQEHQFYRLDSPPWMNVIPFTEEKQIVMIQQFRQGTQEFTWEIPGGIVDPHEISNPSLTAARELEEETGYTSESIESIGVVEPNPAIMNNLCSSFVAWNCKPDSEQNFDTSEDIAVCEMGEWDVFQMIQTGEIKHALVICAFYFYWSKNGFPKKN